MINKVDLPNKIKKNNDEKETTTTTTTGKRETPHQGQSTFK
jgi:hypothetical protein